MKSIRKLDNIFKHLLRRPAHVDARGRGVGPLRDGVVDADPPAVDLLVAHALFGGLRVLHRLKVNEGEAPGPTGLKQI